ncbi:MAG TPA: hypothetical protein VGZ26_04675 [Pirellulales bacterium]|jgi:hypothetical protein|nr:hypothetical protein [Pirellulales bacterium]
MNKVKKHLAAVGRFARQAGWMALTVYFGLLGSPALAAAKRKVVEEAETKSYTMPYLIVVMMIGLGLMAVCRPSRRTDKPDDQFKKEEEDA